MKCGVCGREQKFHASESHTYVPYGCYNEEDIRLKPSPGHGEPEPCFCCGMIADDYIATKRLKWRVCNGCAELTPVWLVELKEMLANDSADLKFAQSKIRRYKQQKRLGV